MAYENGYDILEYFGGSIQKYKEDPMIFTKALAIINTYQNRSDWPHCIDDMEAVLLPILGDSFVGLGFQGFYLEDDRMDWPESTPKNYKVDAISFYKTINTMVNQFYFNRTEPLKLYSIVSTKNNRREEKVIRFIRNDGKYIEFEMDNYSINQAISVLNELMEQEQDES